MLITTATLSNRVHVKQRARERPRAGCPRFCHLQTADGLDSKRTDGQTEKNDDLGEKKRGSRMESERVNVLSAA